MHSDLRHIIRRYQFHGLGSGDYELDYECFHLMVGQGVVGKAFSSRSACFCKDVSNLSIFVNPSVLLAREFGLSSCFAICLKSTQVNYFIFWSFFCLIVQENLEI